MKTCICCGCILREDKEDDNEEVKNVKRIKFI